MTTTHKLITLVPFLALIAVAGCAPPPPAPINSREQQARDADHAAIRQERAQQEYWEYERGSPSRH